MKDIITTSSPGESYELLRGLWATDLFRKSEYIDGWATKAANRRPLLFTMTHPDIEWSHFTSYFCCLARREYDNPVIQDLYYLHELIHVAEMPHQSPVIDFYNWRTEVFRNELLASLHSEAYVYFEIPELREASFGHEIWVDRFLTPRWRGFYRDARGPAKERIRRERKLVSTNPNPHDPIEQQIAGYFHQNIQWAEIWRKIYPEIAEHMHGYVHGGIGQKKHKAWLESKFSNVSVVYGPEAYKFAQQYNYNKSIFGNNTLPGIK